MPIEYVSRFPVDDTALSALHARAFGGDPDRVTPWAARLSRGLGTGLVRRAVADVTAAGCAWLHVDFEDHLSSFYLDRCGFRPTAAGVLRLPAGR